MRSVVIFNGGEPLSPGLAGEIPDGAYLIAADSGLDHALSLGFDVDIVIGDMDSVGEQSLGITQAHIERHSPDKDATDLDLALQHAVALEPDRILLIGGQGGRFDHLIGVITLLASDRWIGTDLEWISRQARVRLVRSGVTLHGAVGTIVTLLAINGEATGVTTTGLRWNLTDETLYPGSTLGVSNIFTSPVATIRLTSGALFAIQPDRA